MLALFALVGVGFVIYAQSAANSAQIVGVDILDGIGSTEMLHIFCSNTAERLRPGSSGTPVPGYDLKLLGDEGEPVPQGETGTLYVRGDSALAGYWRQHNKTKQTVLGDWVWTGDRYRQDADGFWWHQGRVDDMLKVGGLWVSPVEMEQALAEHPARRWEPKRLRLRLGRRRSCSRPASSGAAAPSGRASST